MEMPAPTEAASPTRNVCHVLCVANAAAKSGARVETEPSISPARPGCTYCSTNNRREVSSSLACRLGQDGFTELVGEDLMFVFRIRKFVQQLSDRRITRRLCGLVIVSGPFQLHGLGIFSNLVETERPC